MEFFTNIRRSLHSATSRHTPWMDATDLLEEYDAAIRKNQRILVLGATGNTAREARAELAHYRSLRAVLLAG